jgi:hypothetical protein
MNLWLTVRTCIALFLTVFGIGFIFVATPTERLLIGSLITAIGLTFLLRMALVLRAR